MKKKKQIIDLEEERYGMFMTDNSFELDVAYGRNFLKTDNPQYVYLHKINILKTKSHELYGQAKAKDKSFMAKIRLNVMVGVDPSTQKYYGESQGGIVRDDTGNLVFGIYLRELEEKNTDIVRGDIIEYNMSGQKSRYYEVENANMIVDETNKTIGGFKPYWRKVIAVPVKSDTISFDDGKKGIK